MTTPRASARAQKAKAPLGQRNDTGRMRFASWLVLTPSQRDPRTQQELAKEMGVANSTLSAWRRLPLIQAITKDWRESYKAHFSEVVDALMRQARRGNVPASRLLAEILGELAPTKTISAQGTLADFLSQSKWDEEPPRPAVRVLTGGKAVGQ